MSKSSKKFYGPKDFSANMGEKKTPQIKSKDEQTEKTFATLDR